MSVLLTGNLQGLELPRDLAVLRRNAETASQEGHSLTPLYQALANEHPIALGELVYGPKALRGEQAVRAALSVIEVLEAGLQPKSLYPRLAQLSTEASIEVLELATQRFPTQKWVHQLSTKLNVTPGLKELEQHLSDPDFFETCLQHARLGHFEALHRIASTGRAEPVAAFLVCEAVAEAIQAGTHALYAAPECPLIPWIACSAGPQTDDIVCRLLPHIRSRHAIVSLHAQASILPKASYRLQILLSGVR